MKILIKNGIVIDMANSKPEIKDILIENDKIIKMEEKILDSADKVIDATNKAILPGFINCHNHCAMSIFRGYSDDLELQEWLENAIWPVEDKLTPEDVYYASLLSCIEMIKSGTTTFNDMYFFMEETAKAVEKTGIRANLGRTVIFDNEQADIRLKEAEEFYKNYNNKAQGRIKVNLAPHAPYTCNPDTMKKCSDLAKKYNMQIHVHLSETEKENKDIEEKYGVSPTKYIEQSGLLDCNCVLAHGVHLSDEDLRVIKKSHSGISHNPISNLKLASGISDIIKIRQEGIPVGLGTDGAGSTNTLDMFEEMKVACYLQKVKNKKSSCINAKDALTMATKEGAKVLNLDEIGTLEVGKKADIIIIDLNKPHLQPVNDIYSTIVYSATGQDVDTTIIDGNILMENRVLLNIDENEIIAKNIEVARKYF